MQGFIPPPAVAPPDSVRVWGGNVNPQPHTPTPTGGATREGTPDVSGANTVVSPGAATNVPFDTIRNRIYYAITDFGYRILSLMKILLVSPVPPNVPPRVTNVPFDTGARSNLLRHG